MASSLKVAVIGAGVAGLVTARELQRDGHRVTVYEKSDQLGGTWLYDPRVESDPLSLDSDREIIHSSLYYSLRTNFPRHCMSFSDYSFTEKKYVDSRTFPAHEEVLKFLNNFADDFQLTELIQFNTEVIRVEQLVSSRNGEWIIESRRGGLSWEEVFEAVVVCNGHHTEPRLADFPGIEKWPGKQIHSHNYRVPQPFQNQIVVIIGAGPSAFDISREIAVVAKEVHISTRSPSVDFLKLVNSSNVTQHSKIDYVDESGRVAFEDGTSVYADIILHCTGYKFNFPFLRTNGILSVEDNCVGPLYKHVFSPRIPYDGTTVQVDIACLSSKLLLPSKETMLADTRRLYQSMEERGIPKHYTHSLYTDKFEYLDWLAAQVGVAPLEERIKKIFKQLFVVFFSGSEVREWDVDGWINSTT